MGGKEVVIAHLVYAFATLAFFRVPETQYISILYLPDGLSLELERWQLKTLEFW